MGKDKVYPIVLTKAERIEVVKALAARKYKTLGTVEIADPTINEELILGKLLERLGVETESDEKPGYFTLFDALD